MGYLINIFRGFCMALADSVPGVSGGTIAFILGFYDKFINSLNDIIYGNFNKKKEAFIFLIKLFIGWIIGALIAATLLAKLFKIDNAVYDISSLFLGFILFSIPIIIKEEKDILKGNHISKIFMIIGLLIVVGITYSYNYLSFAEDNFINDFNFWVGIYLFVCGAIAISAMVLPGISGSTLLMIFGIYYPIISTVPELLKFNFHMLPQVICLGLGIITGIILVIKLIKKCLENHRKETIYLIIGLMIGSLYAIIMGPTTLEGSNLDPVNIHTFKVIYFILGGLIIIGLEYIKRLLIKKEVKE